MNNLNITIREATNDDFEKLMHIERRAFDSEDEANLTKNLIEDGTAKPILSLLAFSNNNAVGHILFTKVKFKNNIPSPIMYILAPLAIIPEYQNKGIGGRLIIEGLRILKEMQAELVFVLGHINYYPKYGFINNAAKFNLPAPYDIPEKVADAWMVQELVSGSIQKYNGQIACCIAMDKEEYWRE